MGPASGMHDSTAPAGFFPCLPTITPHDSRLIFAFMATGTDRLGPPTDHRQTTDRPPTDLPKAQQSDPWYSMLSYVLWWQNVWVSAQVPPPAPHLWLQSSLHQDPHHPMYLTTNLGVSPPCLYGLFIYYRLVGFWQATFIAAAGR